MASESKLQDGTVHLYYQDKPDGAVHVARNHATRKIDVQVIIGYSPHRFTLNPDEAFALGNLLQEAAIDHGYNPVTGEVDGTG